MAEFQRYQQPSQQGGQQAPPPPPKQRVEPYRDGIGRSAQHYDLFEMIRHPLAAKDCRPPDPPPRSALTKQKRIEKQIEKKFAEERKSGPSALATFIKFVFMLFILPPYLILYRLPKFLFVDWIVSLASYIDDKLTLLCHTIQQRVARIKDKIRKAIANFYHKLQAAFRKKMSPAAKMEEEELLSFSAFIIAGIVGAYQITIDPLVRLAKKSWALAKYLAVKIRAFPMQLHFTIQNSTKNFVQFRNQLFQKIKERCWDLKEGLFNKTVRPFSRWIDAQIAKIEALFARFAKKLIQIMQNILYAFRHPIQTGKGVVKLLKNNFHKLARSIDIWLEAKIQQLSLFWKSQKLWLHQKIISPLQAKGTSFLLLIDKWTNRLQNVLQKTYESLSNFLKKILKSFLAFLHPYFEKPQAWLLHKGQLCLMGINKIGKAFATIYKIFEDKISRRMAQIALLFHILCKPLISLWSSLQLIQQPFDRIVQALDLFIDRTAFRLRYLTAWSHVLSRYGMGLVRQSATSILGSSELP